ncbi:MAG: ELM1/GtrOC1 family putative glycosyltransferase [Planctomycetota bacterium]|nr:ELM1/GtrOC1 family putative glycosyltransferase [Planctomycetota bacterium]
MARVLYEGAHLALVKRRGQSATDSESEGPLARPDCVVLYPDPQLRPSSKPCVRIFLGSEPAQHRAERIFIWSILRVRDPARRYEIYLLKDLGGFDSTGWTTGFTNYRFAIPHFAAGEGRAIYNDADQIYLADPGELFDLDMGEHGVLAVSQRDLSVALIDCERAIDVWDLGAAQQMSKKALLSRCGAQPGFVGPLDAGWNTRDHTEYAPGRSKVYHFTTLHTQPWRPFPERFAYQSHPDGELWFSLERSADVAGYHPFSRERPTAGFPLSHDRSLTDTASNVDHRSFEPRIREMCQQAAVEHLLSVTPDDAEPVSATEPYGVSRVTQADLSSLLHEASLDSVGGVVVLGGLESLADNDLPWVLDALFGAATDFVFAAVRCRPTRGREGMPAHGNVRSAAWWRGQFAAASRRQPSVYWELFTASGSKLSVPEADVHYGGSSFDSGDPLVWVLEDDRSRSRAQVITVAEELEWPYEVRALTFKRSPGRLEKGGQELGAVLAPGCAATLNPPWPDLILSSGKRAAAVSRWIRGEAGGRTRIVHIGEDGASPARHFDLTVVPPHARLFTHPRREEACLPVTRSSSRSLHDLRSKWLTLFESALGQRVALLVGGGTAGDHLTTPLARQLARDVEAAVRRRGDSLFVAVTAETPPGVVAALRETLSDDIRLEHRASDGPEASLYAACLLLADVIVVAGGSDSALPDACATDKPVVVYPVPSRPRHLHQSLKDFAVARALSKPLGHRGTPRPQGGFQYLCARMVEGGYLRPAPDPEVTWSHLLEGGRVRMFDGDLQRGWSKSPAATWRVAERIRQLMGRPAPTTS